MRGDDAGDGGAVTVVVRRTVVAVDEVVAGSECTEILVVAIDACVEDGDDRARAACVERPGVGEAGVRKLPVARVEKGIVDADSVTVNETV